MAPIPDEQLGEKLTQAHESLRLSLSSSAEHLVPVLEQMGILLSKVKQSPAESVQKALSPVAKALVMEEFMELKDVDIRTRLALCLNEIIRINAPNYPYDGDKMKDVFELIVSIFKNLSDKSSRLDGMRVRILKTMVTVKYCVIMLDLECSRMIGDMFGYFLQSLRDNQEAIFALMETIMTCIFDESDEDVSTDLINPLLATLRKNNQAAGPFARRLAEQVIKKCADKLGPLLTKVVSSSSTSFDHYSEVIASVCHVKDCSGENICRNSPDDQLASEAIILNENLVGANVKVWWPKDQTFYEGVVDCFYPLEKKHKVVYADGDVEVLNLNEEMWEFASDHRVTVSDEGPGIKNSRLCSSSDIASQMENGDSSSKKKRSLISILKVPSKKRRLANKKGPLCSVSERDILAVKKLSSTLTSNKVAALLRTANISSNDYEVLIPSQEQRANKPPEGYMSVYQAHIEAGLRFPVHDLVIEVCNCMCISPSQLGPNAHRMIVCFILCAKFYKIPVTADYFFSLFEVSSHPLRGMHFCGRKGLLFVKDRSSVTAGWRTKFFFIRPLKLSWNCRTEWSKTFFKPLSTDSFAKLAVNFGITKHHFEIAKLLQKEILVHGGIERGSGTPSNELTFLSMMNKIKSTAGATTEQRETTSSIDQQPSQTDVPLAKQISDSSKKCRLANKKGPLCSVFERDILAVENLSSTLTSNKAAALLRTANISSNDYEVLIPSEEQRANKPPEGYMSVYHAHIEAGLRFPLHDLVIEVSNRMCKSPSQLGPNAHRMIVCFILCAKFYKIPVTADYFFSLFEVSSHPLWGMHFCGRKGLLFVKDISSVTAGWRTKFFFIRPLKESWNCRTEWSKTIFKPSSTDSFAKLAVNFGITKHHFEIAKLLQKDILVHGGIERGSGTPSNEMTFLSMMNNIKSTAGATTEQRETTSSIDQQLSQTDVPLAKQISASSKKRRLANKKGPLCSVSEIERDILVVENLSSTLTSNKVAALLRTANISSNGYEVLIPSQEQRANKPPEGYMSVYQAHIEAGLRFPLHDLVIEVCNRMCISPSQLGANAHGMIVCFILCAKFYKIPVTTDYFFSLFEVSSRPVWGMHFCGRKGLLFLTDISTVTAGWRTKFFFIRPLKESWNCHTEWSKTFLKPSSTDSFAKLAVNFGITKHHFEIAKLLQKEILVHGGIERGSGTPSNELTFLSMMNKIKSTAGATTEQRETTSSIDQQPSQTDVPLAKEISASSKDSTPLNALSCKGKENQTEVLLEPMTDDPAELQALSSPLFAMSKVLDSAFVPKECYQKLQMENQLLNSKLTCTRSRVEELEQELKQSADKIVLSEERAYRAMQDVKRLEETVKTLKSESARDHGKIEDEAINTYKSSEEFSEICKSIKKKAVKDYKESEEYSDSLQQARDMAISAYKSSDEFSHICEREKKDAVKAFQCSDEYFNNLGRAREVAVQKYKSSPEFENFREYTWKEAIKVFRESTDFYTAVHEESVKHYQNGFEACKFQFLNSGQLPRQFNFGFLDPGAGMFGKPPEQVHAHGGSTNKSPWEMKSIKPDI